MKWVLFLFIGALTISPVYAQEFNAGFVQGLWYSQEDVFAENTVRVYVAIRNNSGSDLTGTVEFFDNDTRFERNTVSALDGRIIESWADWTPDFGEHTLTAILSRIELHQVGSTTQAVEVTSALAEETIFVDYDTDNDGIGNKDDSDDDQDGMSDKTEEENGTNPLEFDEPEEEKEQDDENEDEQEEDETAQQANNSSQRQGIEQYLAPSKAEEAIGSFTQTINTAKRNLDGYIQKRNEHLEKEDIAVNEDGFGEISRSTVDTEKDRAQTPEVQKGGFIDTVLNIIGTVWTAIYSILLASTSFALGHPMLVQLFVLIAILFLLYKLARKFGSRPS